MFYLFKFTPPLKLFRCVNQSHQNRWTLNIQVSKVGWNFLLIRTMIFLSLVWMYYFNTLGFPLFLDSLCLIMRKNYGNQTPHWWNWLKLRQPANEILWNLMGKFCAKPICSADKKKRGQIELKTYSSNAKTSIVIRKSQATSQVAAEGRHSRLSKILEHISRLLAYFLFSLYKSNWVKLSLSSTTAHRQRAEYKSNKRTEKILSKNSFHKILKD